MNPAKKNPRDSPARIAGCLGHENDPPEPLRARPTHAHRRAAGRLRGQCGAEVTIRVSAAFSGEPKPGGAGWLFAEAWRLSLAEGGADLGHGRAAIGLALLQEALLMRAEV